MNSARVADTATLLRNGKVLIAGGFNFITFPSLSSSELYDPATNTFAASNATPVMNSMREIGTATLLPNGKVLIAAGQVYVPAPLRSIVPYDPGPHPCAPSNSSPLTTS